MAGNNEIIKDNTNEGNIKMDKIAATEILEKFGRFQITSLSLLCPVIACSGMMVLSFVFINIVPEYKCQSGEVLCRTVI